MNSIESHEQYALRVYGWKAPLTVSQRNYLKTVRYFELYGSRGRLAGRNTYIREILQYVSEASLATVRLPAVLRNPISTAVQLAIGGAK